MSLSFLHSPFFVGEDGGKESRRLVPFLFHEKRLLGWCRMCRMVWRQGKGAWTVLKRGEPPFSLPPWPTIATLARGVKLPRHGCP